MLIPVHAHEPVQTTEWSRALMHQYHQGLCLEARMVGSGVVESVLVGGARAVRVVGGGKEVGVAEQEQF